jgi:hypothetical protein
LRAQRNPWLVVVMGVFALICVVILGVAGYWRYANQLPLYPPPAVVMPVPNAYDDYVAAGLLCRAAGGGSVQPPPAARARGPGTLPPPATGFSPQKQAYEPDVPLPLVRATLARNRAALSRLRQGFHKPFRTPPVLSFSQFFPELADYRSLARVLVAEGKLAEREGRPNAAVRSYLDCLHLGVDVPRGGSLIHGLVGIAIQQIGLKAIQEVVDRLDAPSAAAAAREMARLDARATPLADTLTDEKEGMTASLLQTFRQQGGMPLAGLFSSGTGSAPSPSQVLNGLRFSFTPKRQILDNVRRYMDAVIANARRPYYQTAPPPTVPNDPISPLLLPVFSGTKANWALRDAQWRLTEMRLAARAYELEHGAPPPAATALAPAYLPAVPADPYAPQPMVYRRQGRRAAIYSRGPDGDDDGGKDLGARAQPGANGDVASLKGTRQR